LDELFDIFAFKRVHVVLPPKQTNKQKITNVGLCFFKGGGFMAKSCKYFVEGMFDL